MAAYTYEERLRLALFRTVELLEHAISFEDPNGTVPKFREEIRALASEGPPIIGQLSGQVKAHSRTAG